MPYPSVLPLPEAAGPRPGQPGHFAHHDWLTAAVHALDTAQQKALPNPVSVGPATGSTIVAGAFAALPNPVACSLTTPAPVFALVTYSAWLAFSGTLGGDGRVNIEVTGATVISSTPPPSPTTAGDGTDWYWGDVLYASGTIGISNQLTATRLVKFNTGTTNVAIWAYKLTAVTCTLNYASLRIVPVRWV